LFYCLCKDEEQFENVEVGIGLFDAGNELKT
jgi:hypothetical protein